MRFLPLIAIACPLVACLNTDALRGSSARRETPSTSPTTVTDPPVLEDGHCENGSLDYGPSPLPSAVRGRARLVRHVVLRGRAASGPHARRRARPLVAGHPRDPHSVGALRGEHPRRSRPRLERLLDHARSAHVRPRGLRGRSRCRERRWRRPRVNYRPHDVHGSVEPRNLPVMMNHCFSPTDVGFVLVSSCTW
jgi:hypothetical protein